MLVVLMCEVLLRVVVLRRKHVSLHHSRIVGNRSRTCNWNLMLCK